MSLPFYYSHCVCDNNSLRAAMLNVMQVTFVTLRSARGDILSKGHQTFITLYSRYFKEMMQCLLSILPSEWSELKSPTDHPGLAETLAVADEIVSFYGSTPTHYSNTPIWLVRERLMAHYFSPARQKINIGDVQLFLKLANMPQQWTFHRDSEVTVKLEDDWSGKCKKSTSTLQTKCLLPPGTNLLKFYLGRILGAYKEEQSKAGPLLLYHQHFRSMIGEVLMSTENLGDAGPYVPFFYQIGSKLDFVMNLRMQQSLCHLYFLTVMDHLWSKNCNLSVIVTFASDIQNQLKTAKEGEAVLLWVELQAVVQVLIKQLVLHFDPSEPQKLIDFSLMKDDINNILYSPDMGDDKARQHGMVMARQHGMVLALHFMKLLKSSRKFSEKFFDSMRSIKCINFQELQSPLTPELRPHLFSFLHDGTKGKLGVLYKHVVALMMDLHTGKIVAKKLLQFCKSEDSPNRCCNIKMVLWLVTYYEFYDKKITSPTLCSVFEDCGLSDYISDKGCICLIQCFLDPSHRLCKGNSFSHLEQQTQEPGQELENPGDSLYRLFVPDTTEEPELDLRHSLANLVAVILGRPQHSNHLWYHLFAPQKLENSFITGFMYDSIVHRDGMMYDCGVELTANGEFGRPDYRKHACRGTYTLHSLYLLLWANFGSFCMALLSQPDSYQQMQGRIFSEKLSLRDFCVDRLKSLWKHLSNNLNLLEEQRTFFVMSALTKFHHLSWKPSSDTNMVPNSRGIFKTQKKLYDYERIWHNEVFKAAMDELTNKFPNQHWNETLRQLYIHYPHFPMVQDLTRSIWSLGDLDEHSEGGRLRLLLKFVTEWQCLQVGGVLLPPLVELYQWIHTDIAYLLTHEQASHFTIGQLITQAEKKLNKQSKQHIRDTYNKVKQEYNEYVQLRAGATGPTATISDNMPLVDFLTDDQGKDMLYVVIARIIKSHNNMIKSFYSVHAKRLHYVLPEKPAEIAPREVTLEDAIPSCKLTELHSVSSFMQLVRSRYEPSTPAFHSQLPFQLDRLEEDITSNFIVGKPFIGSPSQLRKVFKFNVAQDVSEQLPDTFKVPLHDTLLKKFKYDFHSSDYHLMAEVVTALRTILGHLVKALDEGREVFEESALKFILNLHKHLKSEDQALQEIGVHTESKTHLECLTNLPLTATYSCFKLFSHWVDEGYYDFKTLPFRFKADMRNQDQQCLEELRSMWTDPVFELMKELQHLIKLLKQSENKIISQVDSAADQSILDYLTDDQEVKYLVDYIPRTIMLHHYVEFRLAIRRLQLKVQEELNKQHKNEARVDIWYEYVDLGEKYFPNFRVEHFEGSLEYNPKTGYQDSESGDETDNFATAVVKEAADSVPRMPAVSQQLLSLKACCINPDGVAEFLTKIGLSQYADTFKDYEISGDVLLEADPETLSGLGVKDSQHQKKITQLFPRELLGTKAKYSNDHLSQFLQQNEQFCKYIPVLKNSGIDGDMILHADIKSMTKEIGINSADIIKIRAKYKKYVSSP